MVANQKDYLNDQIVAVTVSMDNHHDWRHVNSYFKLKEVGLNADLLNADPFFFSNTSFRE